MCAHGQRELSSIYHTSQIMKIGKGSDSYERQRMRDKELPLPAVTYIIQLSFPIHNPALFPNRLSACGLCITFNLLRKPNHLERAIPYTRSNGTNATQNASHRYDRHHSHDQSSGFHSRG